MAGLLRRQISATNRDTGSTCSRWDPCTGACGSRLQSSNLMRLCELSQWVQASLTCVLSALTDPAYLWLLLSVVVIVTRFRCPQFLLFMAEGLKPTSDQGQTLRSPQDCTGNTSLAPYFLEHSKGPISLTRMNDLDFILESVFTYSMPSSVTDTIRAGIISQAR